MVGHVAETLLEAGGVAGMDPEHPGLGRLLMGAIGIFDGELRLASLQSAHGVLGVVQRCHSHPTPPKPTSAVREPGFAHICCTA